MAILEQELTLEAFLKLPEEKPALEFHQGGVTQKVAPQIQHGRLQFKLGGVISGFAEPRRLAMVFTEMRTILGGSALVPDISVYRWERVPFTEEGELARRFEEPPDIAIEVVSPDQRVTALIEKCLFYVEHSVEIALLVDPDDRLILLFRPGGRVQALRGTEPIDLSAVLPGFELTAQDVFALLRRPKSAS